VTVLFLIEVNCLATERLTEKLTENIRAESVCAGWIRAEVMTARSQHQVGAALATDGRQGGTIDISHDRLCVRERVPNSGRFELPSFADCIYGKFWSGVLSCGAKDLF
jgi:hypothetical protein